MKSFIAILVLSFSFSALAKSELVNCSIGGDNEYSVQINLAAKTVELWEMAGSGVAFPALAKDIIIKQELHGDVLVLDTKKTGRISITTDWRKGGWGQGTWKHNRLLDSRLQYAGDTNSNGVATLSECSNWNNPY